jgi:hypothetical protein
MIAALASRPNPGRTSGPERLVTFAWALAGLIMWLISLGTCLVCETEPEFIYVGYSLHESAKGTTERPPG